MIVTCKDCGKKYRLAKEFIRFESAKFKCRACSSIITVHQPKPAIQPDSTPTDFDLIDVVPVENPPEVETAPAGALIAIEPVESKAASPATKGFSLRTKMALLFLVIPLTAFAVVGVLLLHRMDQYASVMTDEATTSVTQSGEELVRGAALSVANQCRQYLLTHPNLTENDIMSDRNFQEIAVQRVGLTGYTAMYAVNPMVMLSHPNQQLIGKPLTETIRATLGKDIDRWTAIVNEIDHGENSERSGYYLWVDPDGILREKFMVLAPLKGTKYGITATIYMEEFLRPIKKVEREAAKMGSSARRFLIFSLSGVLLLIGSIVSFYSYQLTRKVNALAEHARRISVGELDASFDLKSKDELGSLGDAIKLMQDSIRIAIERLRKRSVKT